MPDTVKCQLQMPNQARLFDHIKENAGLATDMITADSHKGQSVLICGAGPSLNDSMYLPLDSGAHAIWACNSALPYLIHRGIQISHGFTIDQGVQMLGKYEWKSTYDVTYLISSSVHPALARHLVKRKRIVKFFHSYLGIPDPEGRTNYEMRLYELLYPTSVMAGHGLNSVPRAVCLALAMGFDSIMVYGADCGVSGQKEMPELGDPGYPEWLAGLRFYADGRTASYWGKDASFCEAVIDGKRWHTRADMVISALHLLELQAQYPGRITLVGDTLPNALRGKDKQFMERMPTLTGMGEVSNFRTEKVTNDDGSQTMTVTLPKMRGKPCEYQIGQSHYSLAVPTETLGEVA